jgi:hypothetical protein
VGQTPFVRLHHATVERTCFIEEPPLGLVAQRRPPATAADSVCYASSCRVYLQVSYSKFAGYPVPVQQHARKVRLDSNPAHNDA